jgi:hypothetical protein
MYLGMLMSLDERGAEIGLPDLEMYWTRDSKKLFVATETFRTVKGQYSLC